MKGTKVRFSFSFLCFFLWVQSREKMGLEIWKKERQKAD